MTQKQTSTPTQRQIYELGRSNHLSPDAQNEALRAIDGFSSPMQWQQFWYRLLLGLGTLFIPLGVIFLIAFNWDELTEFHKMGMVSGSIIIALIGMTIFGIDTLKGKLALTVASILVGALLALLSQIYPTGADSYKLFMYWATFTSGWVILGRFTPLWFGWQMLVTLTLSLFMEQSGSYSFQRSIMTAIVVMIFNLIAHLVWMMVRKKSIASPRYQWTEKASCLLALGFGTWASWMSIANKLTWGSSSNPFELAELIVSFLTIGLWGWIYWLYRRPNPDMGMLAMAILSILILSITFIATQTEDALLTAIIGFLLTVGGVYILKQQLEETA